MDILEAYYAKDLLGYFDVEALSNPKESLAPVGCAKRGPLRLLKNLH